MDNRSGRSLYLLTASIAPRSVAGGWGIVAALKKKALVTKKVLTDFLGQSRERP
jgi:hypothetical protein